MTMMTLSLLGKSFSRSLEKHAYAMHHYQSVIQRCPTPLGKTLIYNREVPDDKVIGFHGGCGSKWLEQAAKVHTTATHGGLYVCCTSVAVSYAKDQKDPVIIKLAADIPADRDHTSGIGAHFQVPQGTPVLIKSVHEINPEYLEYLAEMNNVSKPSFLKTLKEDPIVQVILDPKNLNDIV